MHWAVAALTMLQQQRERMPLASRDGQVSSEEEHDAKRAKLDNVAPEAELDDEDTACKVRVGSCC